MNVVKLNTISLDGDTFIKKGGSSNTAPTRKYTGHADVEGLKAIGWDNEDIAYFQKHGVNWDEEDDIHHKVSEDNKALYGVLTVDNIKEYKDRIVYLPKIDTSNVTSMYSKFGTCRFLLAIPMLDTSKVTKMSQMFYYCSSLRVVPQLDTSKVTNMENMFSNCHSIEYIPQLDTSELTNTKGMFSYCTALKSIPQLDTSKVWTMDQMFYNCYNLTSIPQLDTRKVTKMASIFQGCSSLNSIPPMNTSGVTDMSSITAACSSLQRIHEIDVKKASLSLREMYSLVKVYIKNLHNSLLLNDSNISKESILYIINNEAATSSITLTLHSAVYDTIINDEEIIAALEAHPNISLAK